MLLCCQQKNRGRGGGPVQGDDGRFALLSQKKKLFPFKELSTTFVLFAMIANAPFSFSLSLSLCINVRRVARAGHRGAAGGSAEAAGAGGAVGAGGRAAPPRAALPARHRGAQEVRERRLHIQVPRINTKFSC